jgi:hypothetical protein
MSGFPLGRWQVREVRGRPASVVRFYRTARVSFVTIDDVRHVRSEKSPELTTQMDVGFHKGGAIAKGLEKTLQRWKVSQRHQIVQSP